MEVKQLDFVLVSLGLFVFAVYNVWLVITIKRNPRNTVIGLNAESRTQWLFCLMEDPVKNGVLMVQTFRNNMMASTLLATTAITLSSVIGVFVSSTSTVTNASSRLVFGNKSQIVSAVKYFALIICFLVAFLCNVQSLRYYAHVSFLATLPTSQGKREAMEYAARSLNRGSFFWTLGLRAFYLSFPLFLWIFGPIPMFGCCCLITLVLYFLDTTNDFTRQLHCESMKDIDYSFKEPATPI
ncbi:uncharacterized protein LOC110694544 [Chenopodium quinoa]|uniref:uncharacterized protein LOC110694544 n=1 Tax=Chenopodium quinoa TaxID=63459 RepID=UPI000B7960A0|nr:uncharacterized protein LOC110694544 [Chenopodium quinoa]